ncbi:MULTISPECIES: transcriptional regulator domain-containing protein [Alphaproteobacteria]|jgi:hypothetical protein|uniref:transcriptional regulator domain-containing protein n=1 Tax=Alphaproteobacteria TaxID=28211 RepID=UPI001FCB5C66|nr:MULTISPECIES: DUF6499 domain-containing protein [Hyphomicrobiales]MCT4471672.1 DUF6499 domain-containing protein [Bosea spartocytisi]
MSAADWRSADAYQELRLLDAPAFAFEFLRRNSEFQEDHRRLAHRSRGRAINPLDAETAAFAERWGVRFRPRIARPPRNGRSMDSQSAPSRRHHHRCARRTRQS